MPGTASLAQLNIRMDREVKASGESAIADMGISVSDFVRQLWERLSGSDEDRAAIEQAVLGTSVTHQEEAGVSAERMRKLAALEHARTLRDAWMQSVGMGEEALLGGMPCLDSGDGHHGDRERALEALKERMEERGTW